MHEFHVWQLAGDRIIASAHIRCLNLSEYMKIAENVKEFFHNEGIHSTTIQPEFVEFNGQGNKQSKCRARGTLPNPLYNLVTFRFRNRPYYKYSMCTINFLHLGNQRNVERKNGGNGFSLKSMNEGNINENDCVLGKDLGFSKPHLEHFFRLKMAN